MATVRHAAVLAALLCCIAQTGAYYLPGGSLRIGAERIVGLGSRPLSALSFISPCPHYAVQPVGGPPALTATRWAVPRGGVFEQLPHGALRAQLLLLLVGHAAWVGWHPRRQTKHNVFGIAFLLHLHPPMARPHAQSSHPANRHCSLPCLASNTWPMQAHILKVSWL
jgi:hypothetical protein